jgi:hypothetical protein
VGQIPPPAAVCGRLISAAQQSRAPELHVGRATQLPEISQVQQIVRPSASREQLPVARAAGDLRRQFVRPEPAERAIQRQARSCQPVLPEIGRERERVLGFRHRVQVPAVQLAELLAELADVQPQVTGEASPVGVAFLNADFAVLETHEDLGARVTDRAPTETDLDFARIEIVALIPTW